MRRYFYDPPALIKSMFKDYIWNSQINKILLTFDDGPTPDTTPAILEELNKSGIKAAFFCVGENITKYSKLAEQILSEGHIIGNHTYNHKRITTLTRLEMEEQIESVNEIYESYFGSRMKFFRPPHGRFNYTLRDLLRKLNMVSVQWSLLTYDYQNNFEKVKFAVDNYLEQDSLVVLHDSLKSKDIIIESIQYISQAVKTNGYQIGTPQECLK